MIWNFIDTALFRIWIFADWKPAKFFFKIFIFERNILFVFRIKLFFNFLNFVELLMLLHYLFELFSILKCESFIQDSELIIIQICKKRRSNTFHCLIILRNINAVLPFLNEARLLQLRENRMLFLFLKAFFTIFWTQLKWWFRETDVRGIVWITQLRFKFLEHFFFKLLFICSSWCMVYFL